MKAILISLLWFITPSLNWIGNFDEALKMAAEKHKPILINFSGSDWCGPCIRLKTEIFESEKFEAYASENLILVRADFPRQKKNRISAEQTRLNEILAERYNPEGKFPYTLLVDEKGKVIRAWEGFPKESPEEFVAALANLGSK